MEVDTHVSTSPNMKGHTLAINEPTAGRADKASMNKAIKEFAKHERLVTAGEATSLAGWWAMAEDAVALFGNEYGVATAYAKLVHKSAQDNTEGTIRIYVGAVLTAMKTINKATGKPFRMKDFKGIGHLRTTVKSGKKGKAPEPFRNPVRKVSAPTRNAYEALMKTAEFRALPAQEKKIIKMLARGENFSTATL
jgi:hypothetical protein